jgi:hypothetical protein
MNKIYGLCLFFLALITLVFLNTPQTSAASDCFPLFNGGVTSQQYCFHPTSAPENALPGKTQQSSQTNTENFRQQTKGGQTIYPSAKSKTTPNTGPEEWSLPVLFFIGFLGFLIRNKAKT